MTEYAPDGKRGYYAALPSSESRLVRLWHLPFTSSCCICDKSCRNLVVALALPLQRGVIAVAIYIRLHLKESPSFAKSKLVNKLQNHPYEIC